MCLLRAATPPAGHRRALHRRLRIRRGLRSGRDRAEERPIGRPLRKRFRVHVADGRRRLRVPEAVRLPRLRRRAHGWFHEARGLPVSTIAVRVSVGARAPLDGDGRVTLDCYGRVGNMAPPFGLWQLIRSRRRGSREIPTGRTQGVPMTLPSPSPSISLAARTFGLLALALTLFGLGGACEDKHVGRPCELGTMPLGGTSGQVAQFRRPRSSARAASACCPAPRRIRAAQTPQAGHRPALHGRLRGERRLRGRREGQPNNADRPALPRRLRLRVADDCRRLRVPELLRLHRLRQRSDQPAGRSRASAGI